MFILAHVYEANKNNFTSTLLQMIFSNGMMIPK